MNIRFCKKLNISNNYISYLVPGLILFAFRQEMKPRQKFVWKKKLKIVWRKGEKFIWKKKKPDYFNSKFFYSKEMRGLLFAFLDATNFFSLYRTGKIVTSQVTNCPDNIILKIKFGIPAPISDYTWQLLKIDVREKKSYKEFIRYDLDNFRDARNNLFDDFFKNAKLDVTFGYFNKHYKKTQQRALFNFTTTFAKMIINLKFPICGFPLDKLELNQLPNLQHVTITLHRDFDYGRGSVNFRNTVFKQIADHGDCKLTNEYNFLWPFQ